MRNLRAGAGADLAELDVVDQAERFRDVGAAFLAHEIGQTFRQFALVGIRKRAIQHVGHDQPEHVVAEKFEALVALGAVARGLERGHMRERGGQQRGIAELVADARLDRRGCRLGRDLGALLLGRGFAAGIRLRTLALCRGIPDDGRFVVHRTNVKMRFQRTAVGQRQNIQAASPSAMEKKIIWARPTIFSNGT